MAVKPNLDASVSHSPRGLWGLKFVSLDVVLDAHP